jgi:hypothetical protein
MQGDKTSAFEPESAQRSNAKEINFALSAIGIAAALVFWQGGTTLHLPAVMVLAVLPIAPIYLLHRAPLLYAIGKPRGDRRTDLGVVIMASGFGLILGASGLHFVETRTLLELAGLVGLLGCASIYEPARKSPNLWGTIFSAFFLAAVYGWGLAAAADSVGDRSAPARYTTTVADKYESYHRGTTYHLVLAPWGPMEESSNLTVTRDAYESTGIERQVCLELHPGVLHVQ